MLDEVAAEEDRRERTTGLRHDEPLHLPYWAELWDSGGGVAAYLVDRLPVELAGRSVLDLGCGQGLLGCVAAALGAWVTFADLESAALLFAELNGWPFHHRTTARRTDWQTHDLGRRFDLIVGGRHPLRPQAMAPPGPVLAGPPGRRRHRPLGRTRAAHRGDVPRLAP